MKQIFYLAFLSSALLLCSSSFGQGIRATIKIDGIQGESKTLNGAIDVLSYSDGLSSCTTTANTSNLQGGSASTCKPISSSLFFMMVGEKATIMLKTALLTGKVIASADLTYSKPIDGADLMFYKIRLENVKVGSIQESGSNENPTYSVELTFTRIAWQITTQSATGGVGDKFTSGWDFALGKPFAFNFQ